jgi:glutaredoxin
LYQYQMIGAAWCDKCRKAKQILQEKGLWELIEYIDFDSPEGKRIAEKVGAEHIPFFVDGGELVEYVGQLLHKLTEIRLEQSFGLDGAES